MDYGTWKRRNGYQMEDKIFICFQRHEQIRESLLQRGWKENPDYQSSYFDFKWAQRMDHINLDYLRDEQYINHFKGVEAFSIKNNLLYNLPGLLSSHNINQHLFFPVSYDLYDHNQLNDFIQHFKYLHLISLLQLYIQCCTMNQENGEAAEKSEREAAEKYGELRVMLALLLLQQRTQSMCQQLKSIISNRYLPINSSQWNMLNNESYSSYSSTQQSLSILEINLEHSKAISTLLYVF